MLELTIPDIISVIELKGQYCLSILPNSHTPQSLFVHEVISNGLIVSTCLICQKVIASPKHTHLTMAEDSHKCIGLSLPDRAQRLTSSTLSGKAIYDYKKLLRPESLVANSISEAGTEGNSDMTSKNAERPQAGFIHTTLTNGLTISTCLLCSTNIGSPTPVSLRMAEENHLCALPHCAGKSKTTKQLAA